MIDFKKMEGDQTVMTEILSHVQRGKWDIILQSLQHQLIAVNTIYTLSEGNFSTLLDMAITVRSRITSVLRLSYGAKTALEIINENKRFQAHTEFLSQKENQAPKLLFKFTPGHPKKCISEEVGIHCLSQDFPGEDTPLLRVPSLGQP